MDLSQRIETMDAIHRHDAALIRSLVSTQTQLEAQVDELRRENFRLKQEATASRYLVVGDQKLRTKSEMVQLCMELGEDPGDLDLQPIGAVWTYGSLDIVRCSP